MNTSGISPSFLGLSRSSGQVTHVLLTRSRLCPRASPGSSLHLHVLSTPPAFVLSQDQTLRENTSRKAVMVAICPSTSEGQPAPGAYTRRRRAMTGYFSLLDSFSAMRRLGRPGGSNLDAHTIASTVDAHAVEFSKTVEPLWKGRSQEEAEPAQAPTGALRADRQV